MSRRRQIRPEAIVELREAAVWYEDDGLGAELVAAHLVDEVLPEEVPVRQCLCSLSWGLRYVLGYDRALCADVLRAFIDALEQCLRRRAKREFGPAAKAGVGAVAVVLRIR